MGFDIDYVLDRMYMFEARSYLKFNYLRDKEGWEQTRWMGNLYANSLSKNKIEIKDTIRFTWDDEDNDDETVDPSVMHRYLGDIKESVSKMQFDRPVVAHKSKRK